MQVIGQVLDYSTVQCFFYQEKGPKGLKDAFYGCERVEKTFWFCNLLIFKDSTFTAVKRDAKFLPRNVKGFSLKNGTWRGEGLDLKAGLPVQNSVEKPLPVANRTNGDKFGKNKTKNPVQRPCQSFLQNSSWTLEQLNVISFSVIMFWIEKKKERIKFDVHSMYSKVFEKILKETNWNAI